MTLFHPDAALAPPPGPLVRVRLTVAYDGRGFHGFTPNVGVRTVGGTLQVALEAVLGHAVRLTVAGRTDAGVHAWGQVVTFDARADGLHLPALRRSVDSLCGPQIAVREAAVASAGFDARRSALSRAYRYTVLNREVADPFRAVTAWHVAAPLDVAAMRLACDPLIGEHDFAAFCRRPRVRAGLTPPSTVRRVLDARWHDLGDGVLRFDVEATSFCQQMVRSLVGTIVDMGAGRRRAGEMSAVLRSLHRQQAGPLAPPHGLCLWAVRYPPDAAGPAR